VLYDSIVFASGEKRMHLHALRGGGVTGRKSAFFRATSLSEGGIFQTSERFAKEASLTVPLSFGLPENSGDGDLHPVDLGDAGQADRRRHPFQGLAGQARS
jgi:hypothetical protein